MAKRKPADKTQNNSAKPTRKPRIKKPSKLPEPFTAEELAESYQAIPAAVLEPMPLPEILPGDKAYFESLGIPGQPTPTADANSIQGAPITDNHSDNQEPGEWSGKLTTEDCEQADQTKKTEPSEPTQFPSSALRTPGERSIEPENTLKAVTQAGKHSEATTQTDSSVGKDDMGDSGTTRSITQLDSDTSQGVTGDDSLSVAVAESPVAYEKLTREESQAAATRRWRSTGIAEQVAVFRDRVREEYRAANPGCKRRDAHEHAWDRAMAKFPPLGVEPVEPSDIEPSEPENSPIGEKMDAPPAPIASDHGVPGLGTMPDSWGVLPANASLQVEISWVSANRLRVRDGTGVDLSKALSPAPSYSALSWLETSILFPSKFADISVKATANQDDEKESIRREKMAIEEIRGLLAEMLEE